MKKINLLTPILFLCICHSSYANDKPIIVKPSHPEFSVHLPANPTTGYAWFISQYDLQLITPLKHQYQSSKENKLGAGGADTWTFKVNSPAFTTPHLIEIKMIYTRPWDLSDHSKTQAIIVVTAPN